MWHPAKTIGSPTAEPVDIGAARSQCRVGPTDDAYDSDLSRLIKVARDHVEKYCDMRFARRMIVLECDSFADLSALPEAPLKAVVAIKYRGSDGQKQTLPTSVYRRSGDRFAPSISLKRNQSWPMTDPGSRIEVVGVYGGDAPESVQHAMLMLIGHWFAVREAVNIGNITSEIPMGVDALLSNERR